MPFEASLFPELSPLQNIIDYLHMLDINLCARMIMFSWRDAQLYVQNPALAELQSKALHSIGCPLDLRADGDRNKKWFHGAVWHYDFVLGCSDKSLGLDGNMLLLLLLTFGGADKRTSEQVAAAATTTTTTTNNNNN